ncbi:MAG: thiamine pyrophosphate-binding protein [Gemmatimonadetes bacterium]|nr:thiamine pyrophosphate-binding protein [Gemmatimonadota bacterium]
MPTVADLIISRLVEVGVKTLVGMPGGGSNLDLVEAAGRAGLPFVLSHTETAGALIASAQAELTGRPGACLATLGPGVSSLVNGAAHARLDRVPLMLLTDSMPASGRDTYQHQRLDHAALLAPVTKASFTIDADRADEIFTRALALASAPPPGPVHVDLAPDVSRKHAATFNRPSPAGRGDGGEAGGEARKFLAGARCPLVIAGLGARDTCDADAVRTLCENHGIPALVTYKAKGVIPDEHPLFGGVFTHGALERPLVEAADVIIGVGLDPIEFLPRPWDYRAPCVALSRWPLEQSHLPIAASLTGDLPNTLREIDEWLPKGTDWRADDILAHARRQRTALHVTATGGWAPWRAVEAAARAVGPDMQVTVDAGAHMFPIMALWPARRPRQVLISNGLSTMGFALPAAIGAALTDRTRRVLALTGDGGLLMCLAELGTAARERLKVTVIVFNDRSLSLIRIKQERLGYPAAGMSLDGVDWQAAAATFGVPAWRARNDDEMARGLKDASAAEGPALIEAVIDPGSYPETLRAVRG